MKSNIALLLSLVVVPTTVSLAHAQQLPMPRIGAVSPSGAKVGASVVINVAGQNLDTASRLHFSHPGLRAELIPAEVKKGSASRQFKVAVAADAPLGIHDFRIVTAWGVSPAQTFVVGDLDEILEKEPNNDFSDAQRIALGSTVNGTIAQTVDVDYYVFAGKKGQRVIVSCLASSIDSPLVANLELYDKRGRRLAANHRYHHTDALLDYVLIQDDDFYVRVNQFAYTTIGNVAYPYRLSISTAPWIDAVLPPCVEPGKPARLTVFGRNLPGGQLDKTAIVQGQSLEKLEVMLDVPVDAAARSRLDFRGAITPLMTSLDGFEYRLRNEAGASNPFLLTYAHAPIMLDNEANDTAERAQEVQTPCEIAGRIEKRGDRDWYAFRAKKGESLNIELFSERLGFATDMYFRVVQQSTDKMLAEHDDGLDTPGPQQFPQGMITADPPAYRFIAPADDWYLVLVSSRDAYLRGDPRALYRLRIAPERPDFRLLAMPRTLFAGGKQAFDILAWREGGFNGEVALTIEGLPKEIECPPQTLGAGLGQARFVLNVPVKIPLFLGDIRIKGTATINGKQITREARAGSINWPPNQNSVPTLLRVERSLTAALRANIPAAFDLTATPDSAKVRPGQSVTLTLKLERRWPDAKGPVQILVSNLPMGITCAPITIAPGQTEAKGIVTVNPKMPAGSYSLILWGQTQSSFAIPAAQKSQPITMLLPANPVKLTVTAD